MLTPSVSMTLAACDVAIVHAFAARQRDHVGQVVLAACVAVVDRLEPAGEARGRGGHHARVDLADRALLGCRVLVLDDGRHRAIRAAHDAAVSGRVVELDREQRQRALTRMSDHRLERLGARQRVGAEQHERDAIGCEVRQRLRERVSGALRRILQCPLQVGFGKALAHGVAAVTVDHADAIGGELARGVQHMREQWPAPERMQDFRQTGAHPLADACGEDRYAEGRGPEGRHGLRGFYVNRGARSVGREAERAARAVRTRSRGGKPAPRPGPLITLQGGAREKRRSRMTI